jgi:uncharacterized coiled-coil protein SlyX
MTTSAISWLRENYFLGGLFVALFTVTAYVVKLETRVATLETRGSSHLEQINTRLTVTEKETQQNDLRLKKIGERERRKWRIWS